MHPELSPHHPGVTANTVKFLDTPEGRRYIYCLAAVPPYDDVEHVVGRTNETAPLYIYIFL